jgi:hypothetical protein
VEGGEREEACFVDRETGTEDRETEERDAEFD